MNGADDFLGRRVDDFKGLAVDTFDELVVDEARKKKVRSCLVGQSEKFVRECGECGVADDDADKHRMPNCKQAPNQTVGMGFVAAGDLTAGT